MIIYLKRDSGVYVTNVVHNLGLKLKSLSAFVSPYMHSTISKLHLFNLFVPYFGSIKMSVFSLYEHFSIFSFL